MRLPWNNTAFYDLLEAQAQAAHQAAEEFYALTRDVAHLEEHICKIKELEHEADRLTRQLVHKANVTLSTPLDRQDLHVLSHQIDDITHAIESASVRMGLYRLHVLRPDVEVMVGLMVEITRETVAAVTVLRNLANKQELAAIMARINEMEAAADDKFDQAIVALFNDEANDPIAVLKWREVYERIERGINRCEKAAKTVANLLVKYA